MPELSVSEAQLEELESIREELEAAYVGEYGTVRTTDAVQYLLDTYSPPERTEEGRSPADIEGLTSIDGVGEATAEALVIAGFRSVDDVAAAAPGELTEVKGIGEEQAVDIVAAAAEKEAEASESGPEGKPGSDGSPSDGGGNQSDDSPEDTLQQAMSLLEAHDDRWRESSGDEPYEVDLPDGSTEAVRTKDDIKRLVFKHWR